MSKHDDKIKVLLAKVEEQQSGLGVKPKVSWITNGLFKHKDQSKFFNLNTVKDPQVLVEALAFLKSYETSIEEAAEMLGVSAKPFQWDGYSVADWATDFRNRVKVIAWDERKAQLDATKAKLRALRSEDARTGDELEELEKSL